MMSVHVAQANYRNIRSPEFSSELPNAKGSGVLEQLGLSFDAISQVRLAAREITLVALVTKQPRNQPLARIGLPNWCARGKGNDKNASLLPRDPWAC
jgi:hypothetical protein